MADDRSTPKTNTAPVQSIVARHTRRIVIIAIVVIVLLLLAVRFYRPVIDFVSWNVKSPVKQQTELKSQYSLKVRQDKSHTSAIKYVKGKLAYSWSQGTKYVAWSLLASSYEIQGRSDLALAYYQKMLKVKPDDYSALLGAGQMAEKLHDKSLAVQYFQKALNVSPSSGSLPLMGDALRNQIKILQGQQ